MREKRLSMRWDTVMSVLVRKEHLALTHIIHQEDVEIDGLVRLKRKLELVTLPEQSALAMLKRFNSLQHASLT
jgi:hypothetical protein